VVLHNVPGRLRVRVAAHADTAALEMVLRQQRGVEACRRSAQSLLIRYRSGETTADRLLKVVASSLIPAENVPISRLSPPRRQRDRFGDGPAHAVGPPHALGPTSVGGKGAGGLSHRGPLAFRVARVTT